MDRATYDCDVESRIRLLYNFSTPIPTESYDLSHVIIGILFVCHVRFNNSSESFKVSDPSFFAEMMHC